MIKNTWADGLNPTYAPLSDIRITMVLLAALEDVSVQGAEPENVEIQFLIQVLNKRIEVMKLPISFDGPAKTAVLALVDRAGAVVVLLIDCLNAFEGKTVTVNMLMDLYPLGFYDEPTLMRYIDDYMKPRRVKWAEVY